MREAPPPKESPETPHQPYDLLIGGIVSLLIGFISEGMLHPIMPWTYIPGVLFVMVGLGVAAGIAEDRWPRHGKIGYYVLLAGVVIWFFRSYQNISLLPPMLFTGFNQLTRWALKLQPI